MDDDVKIRTLDPFGDECCRETLAGEGKLLASDGTLNVKQYIYTCQDCGRVWLKYEGRGAFTLKDKHIIVRP